MTHNLASRSLGAPSEPQGNYSACEVCGFGLWLPILRLNASEIGLYSDSRFPGRCIVSMREHFDHLNEVPPMDFVTFMEEIQACVDAIKSATGSERVNVAILGNAESHVHAHLIPRYDDDPLPNKAPWEDPRPKGKLPAHDEDRLMEQIKTHLTSSMSSSVVSPVPLSRTRREPRHIPYFVDVPLFDLLADEHSH